MVQRKCGTCRFFRDAGIACSGWCTHPDRGDLHDLVLVRRAELACRNSWDRDLWEQVGKGDGPFKPPSAIPVSTSHPVVPENPTDRVTAVSVSKVNQLESYRRKHPAVTGGQQSPEYVATDSAGHSPSNKRPRNGRVVGGSSLEPSFGMALRGGRQKSAGRPKDTGLVAQPIVIEREVDRMVEPPRPMTVGVVTPVGESSTRLEDTSPLPADELNRVLMEGERTRAVPTRAEPRVTPQARSAGGDRVVNIDGPTGEDWSSVTARRRPAASEPLPVQTQSPIDAVAWSAGIPRCCDTCRDFRPEPDGGQGYCGNTDARIPQTMVQSHELACRSSFGVWWLPSDDAWLEIADVSHHTRPTPYLDELLADLRSSY